jgi:hypothetical protein
METYIELSIISFINKLYNYFMKRPINLIKIKSIYELRNGQILAQIIAKPKFFLTIRLVTNWRLKCLERVWISNNSMIIKVLIVNHLMILSIMSSLTKNLIVNSFHRHFVIKKNWLNRWMDWNLKTLISHKTVLTPNPMIENL